MSLCASAPHAIAHESECVIPRAEHAMSCSCLRCIITTSTIIIEGLEHNNIFTHAAFASLGSALQADLSITDENCRHIVWLCHSRGKPYSMMIAI